MRDRWKNIWNSKSYEVKNGVDIESILRASGYDTPFSRNLRKIFFRRIKKITKKFSFSEEDVIIDAGCGGGSFYIFLKNEGIKFKKLINVDYSFSLLKSFFSLAKELNLVFINAELGFLPFKEEVCTKIFCNSVFFYFENLEYSFSVLKEFDRILKTGGEIVISDVADVEKKQECEKFRKSLLGEKNYTALYKDLSHLYFSKEFFLNFFKTRNYKEINIFEIYDKEYPNSFFRFNVFARK